MHPEVETNDTGQLKMRRVGMIIMIKNIEATISLPGINTRLHTRQFAIRLSQAARVSWHVVNTL